MSSGEHPASSEDKPALQWTLWREDIYGNQYRMPIELDTQDDAVVAQEMYTAKGHHQTYHTREMEATDTTDFIPCDTCTGA